MYLGKISKNTWQSQKLGQDWICKLVLSKGYMPAHLTSAIVSYKITPFLHPFSSTLIINQYSGTNDIPQPPELKGCNLLVTLCFASTRFCKFRGKNGMDTRKKKRFLLVSGSLLQQQCYIQKYPLMMFQELWNQQLNLSYFLQSFASSFFEQPNK